MLIFLMFKGEQSLALSEKENHKIISHKRRIWLIDIYFSFSKSLKKNIKVWFWILLVKRWFIEDDDRRCH